MPKILVPLDGLPMSEAAVPWAAAIARGEMLAIQLVSVIPHDQEMMLLAGIDPSGPLSRADDALRRYLAAEQQSPRLEQLPVTTEIRIGDPATAIIEAAGQPDVSLVVMATHSGDVPLPGKRGRVAERVVRESPVPVLLVPGGAAAPVVSDILLTLDGTPASEVALPLARDLAGCLAAKLHALSVIDLNPGWRLDATESGSVQALLRRLATEQLSHVARPEDVTAILEGPAAPTIVEYANSHSCDLIVMASHRRSGRRRLDLGSTAERVLENATQPVLFVPIPPGTP